MVIVKHRTKLFFFMFSKKYDFMMGDLRTNPYKIAQVIELTSLMLSNPNLTKRYLCRQRCICEGGDDVFVEAVTMHLCRWLGSSS